MPLELALLLGSKLRNSAVDNPTIHCGKPCGQCCKDWSSTFEFIRNMSFEYGALYFERHHFHFGPC